MTDQQIEVTQEMLDAATDEMEKIKDFEYTTEDEYKDIFRAMIPIYLRDHRLRPHKILATKTGRIPAPQVTTEVKAESFGYHKEVIPKGRLGDLSKIEEEWSEFKDAHNQGIKVMEIVELSDMIGAIEAYLHKYHPSITVDDLKAMSDATKRAFLNGHRS